MIALYVTLTSHFVMTDGDDMSAHEFGANDLMVACEVEDLEGVSMADFVAPCIDRFQLLFAEKNLADVV